MMKMFSIPGTTRGFFPALLIRMKFSSQPTHQETSIEGCYRLLDVTDDCSDEELRDRYLRLAKSSHPDKEQDPAKFLEIKNAYEKIVNDRESLKGGARQELTQGEAIFGQRVPQRKQHLEYSGSGTMSERYKQTRQRRVADAYESIADHWIKKIGGNTTQDGQVIKVEERARSSVTNQSIEKLVDDKISESIKRGEFNDLLGTGKPPEIQYGMDNPYINTDHLLP